MNDSFPLTTWAVYADPESPIDATILAPAGSEFEKEVWLALAEAGRTPKGISRDLPNDILIEADPRIFVICKAIAGPHGWFDAIARALYRQYCEPRARTIVVVPYVDAFFAKLSYFCEKHDLYVDAPNTLADTVATLTKAFAKDEPPIGGRASDAVTVDNHPA